MKNPRPMCYRCMRPATLCLCDALTPLATRTRFVILIHPKEFTRIKNNTGRITHLSLSNSELLMGLDFTNHTRLNQILNDPKNHCLILYPAPDAQPLETVPLPQDKTLVILLIDATWASARVMLRLSKNLHHLPRISFTHTKPSAYTFKRQPFPHALSTIESTHAVLQILQQRGIETLSDHALAHFLDPFKQMIQTQLHFCDRTL